MKIIINSRIYEERKSGIQNYIEKLSYWFPKIDPSHEYIYHQTRVTKPLGKTEIYGLSGNQFLKIIFDLFIILFGLSREKGTHFFAPSFTLPFFKLRGYRYIVTIHDLAFFIYPELYPKIYRTYMRWMLKRTLPFADMIITVSESTKKDLFIFFPQVNKENVVSIPLGVSDSFFLPVDSKPIIQEEYFLSVTTHPKRKNILRILEIIGENRDFFQDKKYVIAGIIEGTSKKLLNDMIEKYQIQDSVILFGYADETTLRNLYHSARFFLAPSYYEGFGLPVLEAMASGTLVLSSNTSSLGEIHPHKELQFDPKDKSEIYEKIRMVYGLEKREYETLKKEQFTHAKQFSWEKTARETIHIFSSLSGNH